MTARDLMKNPVVRVLILGVIVAAAILIARGPSSGDEARRVVITGGDVLQLRAGFMRTWQREPTAEELRGALEQHVRQEVLYREALARGYDRDDQVVRRAMQQKMEFLAASQALQEPPTEEEIEAFFSLRQDRYALPAVLTFVRSTSVPISAVRTLRRMRESCWSGSGVRTPNRRSWSKWGDPIMLETSYSDRSETEWLRHSAEISLRRCWRFLSEPGRDRWFRVTVSTWSRFIDAWNRGCLIGARSAAGCSATWSSKPRPRRGTSSIRR